MKKNTVTVIYLICVIIIILFVLCGLFFENVKFYLAAGITAIAMFLFSLPDKNKSKDGEFKTDSPNDSKKKDTIKRASDKGLVSKDAKPVRCEGQNIYINTALLNKMLSKSEHYNYKRVILLEEKTPVIKIFENGVVTQEYVLENKDDEDFRNKYFKMKMSIYYEKQNCLAVLTEGYISDSIDYSERRDAYDKKITYRFEKHILEQKTKNICQASYERMAGRELDSKGIRFPGAKTPDKLRCVGICHGCNETFVFSTYNFSNSYGVPVYSDDGAEVYMLKEKIPERQLLAWNKVVDGINFRYFNSFCCPKCGEPYIDYRKHNEFKRSGNLGCVILGKKVHKD